MKKKTKRALYTVAAVTVALLLTIGVLIIVGNSRNDNSAACGELAYWQSMIKDETLLKDVVIPGAHDAGTYGISYLAETQSRSIHLLLQSGARYLDLRVSNKNGEYRIYHGPFCGVTLSSVLDSVSDFVKMNQTETVILDFQHFDGDAQQGVWQAVNAKLGSLLIANDTDKSDVDFINQLTLGEARGKCLVVWGRETESITANNTVFQRNNDEGTRENSVIHSYYQSSLNKKSSAAYIREALPHYIDSYKKQGQGLFVLQGQLTDGLFVFGPRFREATHTDNMSKYVDSLKSSDDLQYINIIMRDFLSPKKSCEILELNLAKDLVKSDNISQFVAMINNHKLTAAA